jgi:hypothetical protein
MLCGIGATASTWLISACCRTVPPDHPSPSNGSVRAAIDAHCHIFNGADLPIYGFLDHIALQNEFLRMIAAPLVLMISLSVESVAKTYDEERDALQHIIRDPSARFNAPTIDRFLST